MAELDVLVRPGAYLVMFDALCVDGSRIAVMWMLSTIDGRVRRRDTAISEQLPEVF